MSSRKRKYSRFAVGHYMALKKQHAEKIVAESKELRAKKMKLSRIREKVEEVDREISGVVSIEQEEAVAKKVKFVSEKGVNIRQQNPTRCSNGPSVRTKRRRRKETYQAAQEIHGGRAKDTSPGEIGLVETVFQKCSSNIISQELVKSKKVVKQVIPSIYKTKMESFEKSTENMTRSVSIYYSGGIMRKKKYRSVYRDLCYRHDNLVSKRITVSQCPIPKIVPYHRLMKFIKSIDVGTLFSVKETLCWDLPEDMKYDGVYRDLKQLLLTLAKFYLSEENFQNKILHVHF